jgi:amidase
MGMKNLTYESALTQSALIADKELSPVELMQSTLDRIDAANGEVNAIVSLRDHEALLAEAKEAETAERKGWLHGIPIAIKDLANSKGLPTSMGSPLFAGEIAQTDDIMVARLKAAGAIVIGKTNTPEFGWAVTRLIRYLARPKTPMICHDPRVDRLAGQRLPWPQVC